MSQVHIETKGKHTTVLVDGVDVTQKINAYTVKETATSPAQLVLEYGCYEQATIDGEMDVVHVCPKKAR